MAQVSLLMVLAGADLVAQAPTVLHVRVRRADAASPIEGAVVRLVNSGRILATDREGWARFTDAGLPDTVLVAAIGFGRQARRVDATDTSVEFRLEPVAVRVADLTVTGPSEHGMAVASAGAWTVSREAMAAVPIAVEPDPLRALAVVPSITFSSVLSSRPLLRGYDAAELTMRLDGFELHAPYHLGRVFSSLPPHALAGATVRPVPGSRDGGSLGGVIDLRGRSGGGPRPASGEVDLSLLSVSGSIATRRPAIFAAARAASLEGVTDLVAERVPYGFQDVYLSADGDLLPRRAAKLTFFATRDRLGDRARGSGMDWHNLLLGGRAHLINGARGGISLAASLSRFHLEGQRVALGPELVDLDNRIDRLRGELDGWLLAGPIEIGMGGSLGTRSSASRLFGSPGTGTGTADSTDQGEYRAYLDGALTWGRGRVVAGVLVDGTSTAAVWQPRARIGVTLGRRTVASLQVARTSRLVQILTNPQAEPTLAFLEVWREAGRPGVPIPRVDHLAFALDMASGAFAIHAALFGSRGHGLGEPRPAEDPSLGESPFRFGRSRTHGLELRVARAPGSPAGPSWALAYTLSSSERRWDGEWVPWRLDRRHQLRLNLDLPVGSRWRLTMLGELASGQPMARVAEVIWVHSPGASDGSSRPRPVYRFEPEGRARSAATGHASASLRREFAGVFGIPSVITFSVTNFVFGPVAREEPVPIGVLFGPDHGQVGADGVPLQRAFRVPAVPSLHFSMRF